MTDLKVRWQVEGVDALLLGAALAEQRTDRKVSLEGFTFVSHRTEEWFRAVEHGELVVTREMASVYAAALSEASPTEDVVDTDEDAEEIRKEPFGDRANQLRQRVGLHHLVGSEQVADSDAQELISQRDRLIVFLPWLLLATVVAAVVTATDLAIHSSISSEARSIVDQVQAALVPLAILGTAVAAVGIRAADSVLNAVAKPFRTKEFTNSQEKIRVLCRQSGVIWTGDTGWKFDEVEPHLLPRYRSVLRSSMSRMLIAERCVPALLASTPVAFGAAVLALVSQDDWIRAVAPLLVALALTALLIGFWNEGARSAVDVHGAIARGFGYRFDSAPSTFKSRRHNPQGQASTSNVPRVGDG